MKKVLIGGVALVAIALATFSFAHKPDHGWRAGHGPAEGSKIVSRLERIVDLSDEQRAQLETLQFEQPERPKRHSLHHALLEIDPNTSSYQNDVEALADQAAQQAKARVLHMANMHAQVRAILTEEQVETVKAYHTDKKGFHKKRKAMK